MKGRGNLIKTEHILYAAQFIYIVLVRDSYFPERFVL